MPTHAQQVRRRLAALGADVTDTSPRGGLNLTALLPAGVAFAHTGSHEIHADYQAGNRDAGFTALLGIIRQGTFECTTEPCERCGRPDPNAAAAPMVTVALSGKAMNLIDGAGLAAAAGDAGQRAYAALAVAPSRQRGKGLQFTVTTDTEAAAVIAEHCQAAGDALAGARTADTRTDGQVLLTAAERIRAAVTATALAAA